jgi:hypothetical protein
MDDSLRSTLLSKHSLRLRSLIYPTPTDSNRRSCSEIPKHNNSMVSIDIPSHVLHDYIRTRVPSSTFSGVAPQWYASRTRWCHVWWSFGHQATGSAGSRHFRRPFSFSNERSQTFGAKSAAPASEPASEPHGAEASPSNPLPASAACELWIADSWTTTWKLRLVLLCPTSSGPKSN